MKVPLTKRKLLSISIITEFNQIHDTSLNWAKYYEELGLTRSDAKENPELEYEHYLRWLLIKDSPLMKALK